MTDMEQNQQPQPPVFNQPREFQPAAPQYQPRVTPSPMMDPVTAVKTCFKKYFDFKGRARRSEFWWFALFVVIVSSVLSYLAGRVPAIGYLGFAFGLAVVIPELSALTRRLHDTNRSGWWVALLGLCIAGYYAAFAVLLGPNVEMLAGATDAMSMASTIVDAVQSSPTTATVMLCCSLGVILLTIINIIFAIIDSKWGENKYGPSPKYH